VLYAAEIISIVFILLDYYFWASDITLARSPVLKQEEFRSLISAMAIVKTLPI
jgi:hypothetical protein